MTLELVEEVRRCLADAACPANAAAAQRYMKSAMPFRGVPMPTTRRLTRAAIRARPPADRRAWRAAITKLYDDAAYREERYAALVVLRSPRYSSFLDADLLPFLEHLIRLGAWWDLVDEVSHAVGSVLLADREAALPVIRGWIEDPDRWVRRASIICQLGHRERTDRELFADAIAANLPPAPGSEDFFIRKAIGWALREYSKTDPAYVVAFVAAHPDLAPLSRREALRRIEPAFADPPEPLGN